MGMAVRIDASRFKEQLKATAAKLHEATRPAAQAGAQVIYERARLNAPISTKAHYFYIRGKKYGPYAPGNLRDSIYQVYAKSKSYADRATYHISFNKDEAPYGFVYEYGNSKRGAQSFIARSVIEARVEVRQAMKQRFIEEVNK